MGLDRLGIIAQLTQMLADGGISLMHELQLYVNCPDHRVGGRGGPHLPQCGEMD
jgi:hypothetical protein